MSDGKVVFDITGNLSGINSALNAATNTIARDTAKWTVLGQTAMNGLVSAAKAGFNGIKALWDNAFEYNSSMQTYEVNFKTLLGSAEAAQAKMVELKQYAVKTPFAFSDLADATQTLLAFQVSSDDASLALKHLGDISLGDANKLQSLTLAFGQVSSAGKLAGQDLLQMINAGFNPLTIIAEKTGVAYADLKAVMSGEKTSEDFNLRMEAARKEVEELGTGASESAIMLAQIGKDGMISADMVAAAMRIATSEGGLFFNALESASQTAKGQIATIGDSWDTLTGKIGKGVFDKLSPEAFPKVIEWLDELNAAYDKDGWAGLKGAAGGIFEEIGTLAFNAGAGLLTQLYNGITGDTKTTEEVKIYIGDLFSAGKEGITSIITSASTLVSDIYANLTGQEMTAANVRSTIAGLFSSGDKAIEGLLDSAGAFLGDIYEKITGDEATAENIKNTIADLFSTGKNHIAGIVESASTLFSNIFTELNGQVEFRQNISNMLSGLFAAGGSAAGSLINTSVTLLRDIFDALNGDPQSRTEINSILVGLWDAGITAAGSVVLTAGTLVADIYAALTGDTASAKGIKDFWKYLFDPEYKSAVDEEQQELYEYAKERNQLDDVSFFGVKYGELPSIDAYKGFLDEKYGSDHYSSRYTPEEIEAALEKIKNPSEPETLPVSFLGWQLDTELPNPQFNQENSPVSITFTPANSGISEPIELPITPLVDPGADPVTLPVELEKYDIQSQLGAMNLRLRVQLVMNSLSAAESSGSSLFDRAFAAIRGLTGATHASGGIFNAATRFFDVSGMHTLGESGAEALLPLDTLWRKMGLIFDQAFTANLDALQYSVMPRIPAAAPAPGIDEDKLAETIAGAVREAVSGLTVEMDKRPVGRILAPVVSKEIADEVNGRKWTA